MNKLNKFIATATLSIFTAVSGAVIAPVSALAAPHHMPHRPPVHRIHPHPPINHRFRIPPRPPIHRDHRRVVVVKNNSSKTETIIGILGIITGIAAANNARRVADE